MIMPPPADDHSSSCQSSNSYAREQKERPLSSDNTATPEAREERSDREDTLSYREGPPPLHYNVRTLRRERYLAIFFTLLFVESGVLPLILFYSLQWGAHLSTTKNLAIITSLVGTVSGLKVTQRTWQLWFRSGHNSRRPIGAGRWGLDATHILVSVALFAFFVPLVIGSSLSPASVSTVAMALPTLMLVFCFPFLISGLWDRRIRLPVRVSSLPPGELLPPLTYTLVEDVVAVDGGGGLEFRQAWRHRYESSRVMRHLLRVTSIWWGVTGVIVAAGCIVAAWTAPNNTGYGLGYGIPWLWAILMSIGTFVYVKQQLCVELVEWERVHKNVSLHLKEKEVDREADRRHSAFVKTKSRPSTATRPEEPSTEGGHDNAPSDGTLTQAEAHAAANKSATSNEESTHVSSMHDASMHGANKV